MVLGVCEAEIMDVNVLSIIKFKELLNLEETLEMFAYVSARLPGRFHYNASYHGCSGVPFERKDPFVNERGTIGLAGTITREDIHAFDSLVCLVARDDTSKFLGFRFQTIPGYDLEEHDSNTIRLWEK